MPRGRPRLNDNDEKKEARREANRKAQKTYYGKNKKKKISKIQEQNRMKLKMLQILRLKYPIVYKEIKDSLQATNNDVLILQDDDEEFKGNDGEGDGGLPAIRMTSIIEQKEPLMSVVGWASPDEEDDMEIKRPKRKRASKSKADKPKKKRVKKLKTLKELGRE